MKTIAWFRRAMVATLLWAGTSAVAYAAASQQQITLQPGWNAIFIELEPDERDIATVFAGLPVASVWRWRPDVEGAQFVRDPSEGLENIAGWFAWFPAPRPESFLTNLFQVEGNTAYLVKLEGSQSRQITVEGRPLFRPVRWQPNAFTLTGLPVSGTQPPSFAEFFATSNAHANQPIYTLGSDGRWRLVASPAAESILPGRAYWIFTDGTSRYQSPMQVVLDQGESLEFSAALEEVRLVLRNFSNVPGSFQIARSGGDTMPLLYRNEDPETGEIAWPALRESLTIDAPVDADVFVTLAVDRRAFSQSRMDQVLTVTDEQGTRVELYVGGNTIQPFTGSRNAKAGAEGFAGLWIGNILIDKVSEAQQAGTTPTETQREFPLRVLLHVDNSGQARLLKDVIQMWEEGTRVPSGLDPAFFEVGQPGRYVLVTDKDLIGLFEGAATRDGRSVGVRYSTVAYDFAGETLDLEGDFGPERTLQAAVVLEPELPTNPFKHRYHPDHDNLDEQFLNYREEAYRVVRDMQFVFTPDDPRRGPNTGPGWGETRVGGVFEESIIGLHRNPIFVSGRFELRRVSAVPVLNQ